MRAAYAAMRTTQSGRSTRCAIIALFARSSRTEEKAVVSIAKADLIEGMARGMAVLESFDTERQRLNATVAAQRAGITRAAARRHLLTLQHLGYLESDGSHFWLAPKVLRLSGSYLASARLPRVIQPTLNRLATLTADAFSAAVLDREEVVIVARSGPSRVTAYGVHLGARLPAHATSTGRILLAALKKPEFNAWLRGRELPRLTLRTVVEPKAFRTLVEQVRLQDFCVASEEHELGVHALAVPLRDMRGRTVAALNVVAGAHRSDKTALQRDMLAVLVDAARELRPLL
jgi:IclR family transcriptional regulator, pca regulon regulatory protein